MKIGMNLLDLYPGKIGGMEQYVRNFIDFFSKNSNDDMIYLFLNEQSYETFLVNSKKIRKYLIYSDSRHEYIIGNIVDKEKIDIWFCPLLSLFPRYISIPKITTIPDIQHKYYPQFFSDEVMKFRDLEFPFAIKNSDLIITISEFSKKTIEENYKVDEDKIYVTYLDSDSSFNDILIQEKQEAVKLKHNLPIKYFFYPANTWEHKNHKNLFRALAIYKEKYDEKVRLVLTGANLKENRKLITLIKELNIGENVISLGYIEQSDMPYIYRGSSALVFPSLFEGFGIPIIEAFKSQCPVVCSKSASIPEIAKDAVLYFDAENPEDISEKMNQILNPEISSKLISKGILRAQKFSWEKNYNKTMDVFRNINISKKTNFLDNPLVSIITPSYNQGKFIKETIDSVLNQSYKKIEYIVVDGESNDETVEILKSYGDKIKWVSEKDDGQADAVNKGIEMARGDIIGWLNSDDTYLPEAIEKIVNIFNSCIDVDMIYGEGYHVDIVGDVIDRYPTLPFDYNKLAYNCFICQPTSFFKKDVFKKTGLLDKNLQLCMDYELWMRIGKKCNIAYTPHFLATSRMYEDNKTLGRRSEVFEEIISTVKKNYGFVPISWINGYVDYLLSEKNNMLKYSLLLLSKYLKYNWRNLKYSKNDLIYIITKLKDSILSTQKTEYTDQYEDGWISTKYICEMQSKNNNNLHIEIGHKLPINGKIILVAKINGIEKQRVIMKRHGVYELDLNLRDIPSGNFKLEIESNKYCIPHKINKNNDRRKLSVIIYKKELL